LKIQRLLTNRSIRPERQKMLNAAAATLTVRFLLTADITVRQVRDGIRRFELLDLLILRDVPTTCKQWFDQCQGCIRGRFHCSQRGCALAAGFGCSGVCNLLFLCMVKVRLTSSFLKMNFRSLFPFTKQHWRICRSPSSGGLRRSNKGCCTADGYFINVTTRFN